MQMEVEEGKEEGPVVALVKLSGKVKEIVKNMLAEVSWMILNWNVYKYLY